MKNPILILISFLYLNVCSGQTYFTVEQDFPCGGCGPYTANLSELPKYSQQQVQNAYDFIVKSGLEFRYPQGGCQQRAEMMHIYLQRLHIGHARIWLFSPKDLEEGNNVQLEIKDPNGLADGGKIKWKYHVAPCLIVLNENRKLDTVIIDPSLDNKHPLMLKDWLLQIENSNQSKFTFLNAQWYFFNTANGGSSSVINGFFYDYAPIAGSVTQYDKATMEREIAANDVAVYLKNKLDNGYNDPNNEIRTLISKVENVVSFFASQERCNQLQNVKVRALLENHPTLIQDAMKYYNGRVAYWIKETQKIKKP